MRRTASTASGVVAVWETSLDFRIDGGFGLVDSVRNVEFWLGFSANTSSPSTSSDQSHRYFSRTDASDGGRSMSVYVKGTRSASAGKTLRISLYSGGADQAATAFEPTVELSAGYFDHWMRITYRLVRGDNGYQATYRLDDLGISGTNAPILLNQSDAYTFTNTYLAAATTTYVAFSAATTTGTNVPTKAALFFDNHSLTTQAASPSAPTALAATGLTTTRLTANWKADASGFAAAGYVLQLVKTGDAFAPGSFISVDGVAGQATGQTFSNATTLAQSFKNLVRGQSYSYRVRATNAGGDSPWSEIITIATHDFNTAPTLDAIVAQTPRYPGDITSTTVHLTGISTGGDDDQNLVVTVASSDPAIVPIPALAYASPDSIGTLTYTPTGVAGSSTITVTVTDRTGSTVEGTVSRSFNVRVQQPPEHVGFNVESDLDQFGFGTSNATGVWNATGGAGHPPGPGLVVSKQVTTSSGTFNGWRSQPYNLAGKTYLNTSILLNTAAWNNSATFYLGFATNGGNPPEGSAAFLNTGTTYRAISARLEYSTSSSGRFRLRFYHKSGTGSSSSLGSEIELSSLNTGTNAGTRDQWLRLNVTLIPHPTTANAYNAVATLEKLGTDGTAEPVQVMTTGTVAVTNAAIFDASGVYAAYNLSLDSGNTGATALDDHEVIVSAGTPEAPTALAPTGVTTTDFVARWIAATSGPSPTGGFILEMIPSTGDFSTGPFIQANGSTAATGVEIPGPNENSQAFTGLARGTSYSYRIRAKNTSGAGENSGVIVASTSADNIPPTLDAITAQAALYPSETAYGPISVSLTGITNGGDAGQTLSVSAVSSDHSIVPDPVVDYTSPSTTGTLTYTPTGTAGTATITVTVTDSGDGVNTIVRTFTVRKQHPAETLGFNHASDMDELGFGVSNGLAQWGASYGAGNPATGGVKITKPAGANALALNGWRSQPYDLTGKTYIATSVLINTKEWTSDAGIYLGFATNGGAAPSGSTSFFSSSSASTYRGISAYLEYSTSDSGRFRLQFHNKTGTGSSSTVGTRYSLTNLNSGANLGTRDQWLRFSVILLPHPTTANAYSASAVLEKLGIDGTATAVEILRTDTVVTNAEIFAATRAYSAYNLSHGSSNTGATYLDDHEAEASADVPKAPAATAATVVTRDAFTTHWSAPSASAYDGYLLEIIRRDEDYNPANPDASFVVGNLLDDEGNVPDDLEFPGISLSAATTSLRLEDFDSSTTYLYRVRAVNSAGAGPASNIIELTTLAPTGNLPPTLDAITGIGHALTPGFSYTVPLSGITTGGETDQSLEVVATTSDGEVLTASVAYAPNSTTGTLTLSAGTVEGTATVTVTVFDGPEEQENRSISRTFSVTVKDPPSSVSFDSATDFSAYVLGQSSSGTTSMWGESFGVGSPAGGGVRIKTTGAAVSAGWLPQPYAFAGATSIRTSIMVNLNQTSKKVYFAVGFSTAAPGSTSSSGFLMDEGNSSNVGISASFRVEDYSKLSKKRVYLKSNGSKGAEALNNEVSQTISVSNWMRLSLTVTPTGTSTAQARYLIEHLGADGTAEPVTLYENNNVSITNAAALLSRQAIYAAYNVSIEDGAGTVFLDEHQVEILLSAPPAATLGEASVIVSDAFTVNWTPPSNIFYNGAWVEVCTSPEFAENTFVSALGAHAQDAGVYVAGTTARSQRFIGLTPGTTYYYRVRLSGSGGLSESSASGSVTTLAAGENAAPSLDPIVFSLPGVGPGSGSYTVNLTGITDGGDSLGNPEAQQGLVVTVALDEANPGVVTAASVNYTSPASSGTLTFTVGDAVGVANVAVTVTDVPLPGSGMIAKSVTRTFAVTVRQPPESITFDSESDLTSEFGRLGTAGMGINWSATAGVGGGSGIELMNTSSSDSRYISAWRKQPYNLASASAIETSILIKPSGWLEKEQREQFRLGFTVNSSGGAPAGTDVLRSATAYRGISAYLSNDLEKRDSFYLSLSNKTGTGSAVQTSVTTIANGKALQTQWMRLTLRLIPTGSGGFLAESRLVSLGADGLSDPVELGTNSATLINSVMASASEAYAAFTFYQEKDSGGSIYLDDHRVAVNYGAPALPALLPATEIVGNAFTAHWQAPALSAYDSFLLQVVADGSSFAEGNYLALDGALLGAGVSGVALPVSTLSQRITGLTAGMAYRYRVLAHNDNGWSAPLNAPDGTVFVTTLAAGVNSPPTLNPISFPWARVSPGAGPFAVNLSGITDGGEGGQLLRITVSSSHPGIASGTVNYTSPATTGVLQIVTGNETGTATLTVTVDDGADNNATFSRTFSVHVGEAPLTAGFDTQDVFASEFSIAASNSSRSATWGATAGKNGGGGVSIYYHKDDKSVRYVSGWRKEPYAPAGSNRMTTSMLVRPTGWADKNHRSSLHIGFAHNAPDVANEDTLLVAGSAASIGATLSYDKESSPYLYFALSNKEAGASASSALSRVGIPNGESLKSNWLRLKVDYLPSGTTTNAFDVTATVEDLGLDGTGTPVMVATVSQTLINGTLANSTNAYAGFTHYLTKDFEVTGYTYLDDHYAEVIHGPLTPPVALDGDTRVSHGFTTRWRLGDAPSAYNGFVLELSDSVHFSTFLDATGQPTSAGVTISDRLARGLRITGLKAGTTYYYRVRAINQSESSEASNVITVTTLGVGQNAAPTLDPVVFPRTRMEPLRGPVQVDLSGITDGGELNQTLTVNAVSSNTDIVPHPAVTYTSPANTGRLLVYSGATEGTATITVTVSDGVDVTTRTFTVRVAAAKPVLGFDTPGDLNELTTIVSSNATVSWRATVGAGSPAGGGLVVERITSANDVLLNGWRTEPYDLVGAKRLHTSILINAKEWTNSGDLYLGFIAGTAGSPLAETTNVFSGGTNYRGVYIYLDYSHSNNRFTLYLRNKNGTGSGVALGSSVNVSNVTTGPRQNWLRLGLTLVPNGTANTYTVTTTLEDLGVHGNAEPVELLTTSDTATNATLFTATNAYAGWHVYQPSTNQGRTWLDDHAVSVNVTPTAPLDPVVITAQPAIPVHSYGFTARWTKDADKIVAGYVLEISTATDNFAPGKLIGQWGEPNKEHGIVIDDPEAYLLPIYDLSPSTAYVYRLRALNVVDNEHVPNVVNLTTLAAGVNASPTIDPIANVTLPFNFGTHVVALAKITDGGEDETKPIVSVSSTNPNLLASLEFAFNSPHWEEENGRLTLVSKSDVTAHGTAVITVTVSDGNSTTTRTFTLTVNPPAPAGPSYTNWKSAFFPGHENDPLVSGPTANPSGDGIANLLKYAFGLDPALSHTAADLPLVDASGAYLTVTYHRRVNATDISYHPEATSNLTTWSQNLVEVTVSAPDGEGFETVTARDTAPLADSQRRFLRVRITTTP